MGGPGLRTFKFGQGVVWSDRFVQVRVWLVGQVVGTPGGCVGVDLAVSSCV